MLANHLPCAGCGEAVRRGDAVIRGGENPAHMFEQRAAKAHDYEGNLVGYYIDADTWREIRALIRAWHDETSAR